MADDVRCRRCGGPAKRGKMLAEECCVPVEGPQKIDFAVRSFEVHCDKCGTLISQELPPGHHSTLMDAELGRDFKKSVCLKIKAQLSRDEKSVFNAVMKGKRIATDEQMVYWRKLGDPPSR